MKKLKIMKFNKIQIILLAILVIGVFFRLYLTSGGNFIFHMDVARDYVDVREMIVNANLRLIGPTSAIDGVYTGPFWYYILGVVFMLTGGDPYAGVVFMILSWAIGGFFLIKITQRWGMWASLESLLIWSGSNILMLDTSYSFHPSLIPFYTPLFIYLFEKYLISKSLFFAVSSFFLAGLFFNFEMNFGIFIPFILILGIILTKNQLLFKTRNFWLGVGGYLVMLSPQILFELSHKFVMTNALIAYVTTPKVGQNSNIVNRFWELTDKFYQTLIPTFLNSEALTKTFLVLIVFSLFLVIKKRELFQDKALLILILFLVVPFTGYIFLPVTVNSWHLGGIVATTTLLMGFVIYKLSLIKGIGFLISFILIFFIACISIFNSIKFYKDSLAPNNDPSQFKNELFAVDYVYQKAEGKNFKVYAYLPSVYDYPYQYIFWWRGLDKYNYLPKDYAYLPDKPEYIKNKHLFMGKIKDSDSGLIFLVMEPDSSMPERRDAWKGNFAHLPFISSEKLGPIEIEIREDGDY